ncbi:MAG: hypothetical protein HY908_05590 [Myxococcales bacterium]|nr:hypothetical protein [Myxococcales bacterium]
MGNERARQKKLAKHKKRRAEVRSLKQAASAPLPDKGAALARRASDWPVTDCYLGRGWDETEVPALVTGVLVRRRPGGVAAVGLILVDRTCLGIKSGFLRVLEDAALQALLDGVAETHGGIERVELPTLQAIAFHALDLAHTLGFAPDRDFPLEFLGPRPAELPLTPFARPDKPHYIAGPDDDSRRILAQLERAVGAGNFHFTVPAD